jgi:hypothetical protein
VAITLRSVPLLGSLRPCRHRASSFRTRSRSPAGVPSRRSSCARFRVATARCAASDLRAFFHRGVRCVRATLPSRDRSMLPWALDRLVFPTLPRASRRPALAGRFAWRPEPLWRPPTRTWGEGRVFRPCLAPCDRHPEVPEGTTAVDCVGSGASRRRHLGRTPQRASKWNASGSAPRGGSTASVRRPKAFGSRRHRDASPKRLVRDPALAPKSGGRWFELLPSILPRLPAYMRRDRSPQTRTPGGVPICAPLACTLAFEKGACCVEPATRVPKDSSDGRAGGTTRRWALGGSWLRHLQQAGEPAQGQTVVVFTGTAETRSEDEVSPPIRRSD